MHLAMILSPTPSPPSIQYYEINFGQIDLNKYIRLRLLSRIDFSLNNSLGLMQMKISMLIYVFCSTKGRRSRNSKKKEFIFIFIQMKVEDVALYMIILSSILLSFSLGNKVSLLCYSINSYFLNINK